MNQKSLLVLLCVLVVGFGGLSFSEAAKNGAKNPLTLYDANGTFLGDLVTVRSGFPDDWGGGTGTTYTVYRSDVDGILEFINGSLPQVVGNMNAYYSQPDCQGQPYILASGTGVNSQWILEYHGSPYRMSTSTQLVNVQGFREGGDFCETDRATQTFPDPNAQFYSLIPVTLPFSLDNIPLPFKIVD